MMLSENEVVEIAERRDAERNILVPTLLILTDKLPQEAEDVITVSVEENEDGNIDFAIE